MSFFFKWIDTSREAHKLNISGTSLTYLLHTKLSPGPQCYVLILDFSLYPFIKIAPHADFILNSDRTKLVFVINNLVS